MIATVNRPDYLRRSIASVLAGSYDNFEIIVTDDAGSQENRHVAASFGDPRVRYRRNSVRLGSALNHKAALTIAVGEYIGLLNDDDEWEPNCLWELVKALSDHPEVVIAFGDHFVVDANGVIDKAGTEGATHRWKRDRLAPGLHRPFYEIALIDQSIPMVASLVRRSAVDWSDSPVEVSSVYDFWIEYLACREGGGVWYCPQRLAHYRVHALNETLVGGERMTGSAVYVYSHISDDPLLRDLRPQIVSKLKRAKLSHGLYLLENGNAREARKYLWEPLIRGWNPGAAIAMAISILPGRLGAALVRRIRSANRALI